MDGTDSTAGLALAPHELLRAFSAKTLARGETYANQGRVATARYEPLDGTLAGTCLGSKGEYYEVEVALSGPRTNLEIEYAVCTCPVGRYCKHAVAMLMAAIPSAPDRAAPQRWQVVLGSLLDEMTAPDADTGGKPLALEFGMLPAGRYHTTPIATLRPLTVDAAKKTIDKTIEKKARACRPSEVNGYRLRVLELIDRITQLPGFQADGTGNNRRASLGYQQGLLSEIGTLISPEVIEEIRGVRECRCLWRVKDSAYSVRQALRCFSYRKDLGEVGSGCIEMALHLGDV